MDLDSGVSKVIIKTLADPMNPACLGLWVWPSQRETIGQRSCRTFSEYFVLGYFAGQNAAKMENKLAKLWCAHNLHATGESS